MKKIIPKKIIAIAMVLSLLISLGFLSGFTYMDDPIGTNIVLYNGEAPEGQDEAENEFEGEETEEGEEQEEAARWICGTCGYIYDPAAGDPGNGIIEGTKFEELPDDWVCPECGSSKLEFEIEEKEQIEEPEGWLAHLEHVLAMRSKHIMVLQRVIEKMIARNPMHPSIPSLQHALESSSKSIQKAQEAVDRYREYLNNSDNAGDEVDDNDTDDNADSTNNNNNNNNNNSNNTTDLENQKGATVENAITKSNNLKENKGIGIDKSNNKNKENNGKNKENNGRGKNK